MDGRQGMEGSSFHNVPKSVEKFVMGRQDATHKTILSRSFSYKGLP